jgi:hypothetical protein
MYAAQAPRKNVGENHVIKEFRNDREDTGSCDTVAEREDIPRWTWNRRHGSTG